MLKKVQSRRLSGQGRKFVIIASRYNARYVDAMVRFCRGELKRAGAADVKVVRVPGAYEIPVVAARLAERGGSLAALICLGVIIRGETEHARLIAEAITEVLMRLQVERGLPVVHEVLLLENAAQAERRCLSPAHNRGREAAQTALEMAALLERL